MVVVQIDQLEIKGKEFSAIYLVARNYSDWSDSPKSSLFTGEELPSLLHIPPERNGHFYHE